jgi:AcrR family transcriptional regulator
MKRPDRRIQRTRKAFEDALVELIQEKGYARVTIKDITERANTAYATFFRHYDGKEALLMACFSDIVQDIETRPASENDDNLMQEGKFIFEHVRDHQALYS